MSTITFKTLKQQKTEAVIHAVAAATNLPAERLIGKVSRLSWYTTARLLLVHIFIEDIGLRHASIQGLFNYAQFGCVGQAYRNSQRRIANNDKEFINQLQTARNTLTANV